MTKPMLALLFTLALLAVPSSVSAAEWCSSGSMKVMEVAIGEAAKKESSTDLPQYIKINCNPGDRILIPAHKFSLVGTVCDFNKTIAIVPNGDRIAPNGYAICVVEDVWGKPRIDMEPAQGTCNNTKGI